MATLAALESSGVASDPATPLHELLPVPSSSPFGQLTLGDLVGHRAGLAAPDVFKFLMASDEARAMLLARIDRGDAAAGNWLGQIDNLTSGLPERHCGEILWQLAERHHRAGQGASAAEAMELLLIRYPRHALADSAAFGVLLGCVEDAIAAGRLRPEHRDPFETALGLWARVHGLTSLRVSKPDMPWPDDPGFVRQYAQTCLVGIVADADRVRPTA